IGTVRHTNNSICVASDGAGRPPSTMEAGPGLLPGSRWVVPGSGYNAPPAGRRRTRHQACVGKKKRMGPRSAQVTAGAAQAATYLISSWGGLSRPREQLAKLGGLLTETSGHAPSRKRKRGCFGLTRRFGEKESATTG